MGVLFLMCLQYPIDFLVDVACAFNLSQPLDEDLYILALDRIFLTAAARSTMAFPAICASSWLSLISMLMTCTGLLKSPPRVNRSAMVGGEYK